VHSLLCQLHVPSSQFVPQPAAGVSQALQGKCGAGQQGSASMDAVFKLLLIKTFFTTAQS
jgi:hypothetical protein